MNSSLSSVYPCYSGSEARQFFNGTTNMRIAIPLKKKKFSAHFGQSDAIALYQVDLESKAVTESQIQPRTADGCAGIPNWLASLNVDRVLVAGLGQGALNRLLQNNIEVYAVHRAIPNPDEIIAAHLDDQSQKEPRVCAGHSHSHSDDEDCGHHHH